MLGLCIGHHSLSSTYPLKKKKKYIHTYIHTCIHTYIHKMIVEPGQCNRMTCNIIICSSNSFITWRALTIIEFVAGFDVCTAVFPLKIKQACIIFHYNFHSNFLKLLIHEPFIIKLQTPLNLGTLPMGYLRSMIANRT